MTFQRSVKRQMIEHLGPGWTSSTCKDNVVLLGPPGTGKSHLAIAISVRACLAGGARGVRRPDRMGRGGSAMQSHDPGQ